MSKLEVDAIEPQSGTTLTIGASGDSVNIASGATITDFTSTGIDDNATSTAVEIDSSNDLNMLSGNKFIANRADNTRNISLYCNNTAGYLETSSDPLILNTQSYLGFEYQGSEKMRIDTSGNLLVGVTAEPTAGDSGAQISNGSYHLFRRDTATSSVFRTFGSGSGEFRTLGNGNAQNTNNSYGAISDRELKENEVEANSQWNDIKALQIKNYNLKSQPNQTHLGVIAQDLEASGMNGVVEQNQDEVYSEHDVLPEGKNIGDVKEKGYKTVKYSILYMKAVKALQEAMERIETLETQRADLEARITALETSSNS